MYSENSHLQLLWITLDSSLFIVVVKICYDITAFMKILYRIAAEIIFVFHVVIVTLVLFGWMFPNLWYFYIAALIASLFSDVFLGYCIVSKWEFDLRKKFDSKINYHYNFATYYTYKITNHHISDHFYKITAMIFLSLSIMISIYFRYMF